MVMGFKNNWRDGDMRDVEIYINTIQYVTLKIKPALQSQKLNDEKRIRNK